MSETPDPTLCPKCGSTRTRRKERKMWMRAIPGSGHFSCSDCSHKFVARLSKGDAEKADTVVEPKPAEPKAVKVAKGKAATAKAASASEAKKGKADTKAAPATGSGETSIDELLAELDTRIAALRERAEATAKHLESLRKELDAPAEPVGKKVPAAKPRVAKKVASAASGDSTSTTDKVADTRQGETWTPGSGSSTGRSKKKARGRRRKA